MGFVHTHWFESMSAETDNYIIITQETKAYTTNSLQYIDQMRAANIYTSSIRENSNKKLKFDTTMSVAKTSVQIAMAKGVTSEPIGLLTEFIIKYRQNTGLNV